jgi:hypothetical protein
MMLVSAMPSPNSSFQPTGVSKSLIVNLPHRSCFPAAEFVRPFSG